MELKKQLSILWEKMIIECEESAKEEVMKKVKKVIKKEEPDCTVKEI